MTLPTGRILPVVVVDDADVAVPLAAALVEGGIRQVEVALRTPAALEAVRRLARCADLLVGVGTALHAAQVRAAADAGARFVVSPGLVEAVVEQALDLGLAAIPGTATATEVARATSFGLDLVKFFPAEQLGGVAAVAALGSVFPDVRFVPSGGIGPGDVPAYLRAPAVAAVGAGWVAPRRSLRDRDLDHVRELCAHAAGLCA